MAIFKSRRIKSALAGIAVVGALAFGVWLYDYSTSFRIEGAIPDGVQAVPAEAYVRRPWLNASFLGLDLTYPQAEEKPRFPMDLTLTGAIKSRVGFDNPRTSIRWTIDGETVECRDAATLNKAIRCPKVFGDETVWAEVSGPKEWSSPLQVRLFGNGYRCPSPKDVKVPVGGMTLCFRMKKWPSPSLPLRYDVWLEGAPSGHTYWLRVEPRESDKSWSLSCVLQGSTPAELLWTAGPRGEFQANLTRAHYASRTLTVRHVRGRGEIELLDKEGRIAGRFGDPRSILIPKLVDQENELSIGRIDGMEFDLRKLSTFQWGYRAVNEKLDGDTVLLETISPVGEVLTVPVKINMPNGNDYGAMPIN